jgi:CRISPR/Cas system-associated exonuclease Cas4 (RecB family)
MVRSMAQTLANEHAAYDRKEWNVAVAGRSIMLTPDRVVLGVDGTVEIQRVRTGKKTKSEPEKPIYALLRLGAGVYFAGKQVSVETLYLATGERVPVGPRNDAKSLQKYADAIAGIESGDFHPVPDPRRCPNCPSYFICGER